MTPSEKADIMRRLMVMQDTLRTLMDAADAQGYLCDSAGAKGLAFAIYMMRESLSVYSAELDKWVKHYIAGEEFAAGID